jgi:hypothetical protein
MQAVVTDCRRKSPSRETMANGSLENYLSMMKRGYPNCLLT